MNYSTIFSMQPQELVDWLDQEFSTCLPEEILTVEDMQNASRLLMELSNNYFYLCSLCSRAKIAVRDSKRNGTKPEYEDMVDRKEIIQNKTDGVKQLYSAVSRAVTIHIENNAELKMNGSGQIYDRWGKSRKES